MTSSCCVQTFFIQNCPKTSVRVWIFMNTDMSNDHWKNAKQRWRNSRCRVRIRARRTSISASERCSGDGLKAGTIFAITVSVHTQTHPPHTHMATHPWSCIAGTGDLQHNVSPSTPNHTETPWGSPDRMYASFSWTFVLYIIIVLEMSQNVADLTANMTDRGKKDISTWIPGGYTGSPEIQADANQIISRWWPVVSETVEHFFFNFFVVLHSVHFVPINNGGQQAVCPTLIHHSYSPAELTIKLDRHPWRGQVRSYQSLHGGAAASWVLAKAVGFNFTRRKAGSASRTPSLVLHHLPATRISKVR